MNPSPTRGLKAGWVASLGIGKAPSVIIRASSAPASTYAFSNELGAAYAELARVLLDNGDHPIGELDRDGMGIDRKSGLQLPFAGLHHLAAEKCLGHQVLGRVGDEVADDVVEERRDAGEWANLRRGPEDVGVVVAHPQDQVGEG